MPAYFITEHERMFSAWPVIVDGIAGVVLGTLIGERLIRKIPEKLSDEQFLRFSWPLVYGFSPPRHDETAKPRLRSGQWRASF
jgi:hypothetical protein